MMLLVMYFFGFISQSIYDIMRGQVQISGLFVFDVLATILLNYFSILLYAQEFNCHGGSSFLFNLRFQSSIMIDTICFILSAPLIRTATRYSEFGHGYGLCLAQISTILLSLIIVSITNDNNMNNTKQKNASLEEIKEHLQIKGEILPNIEEKDDTLKELLEGHNNNNINHTITTRCSSDVDQSISSISTDCNNELIKISMNNHVDVNLVSRSKMQIRIHYDQVRVEDLYVSNYEVIGGNLGQENATILQELNLNQITDDKKYQSTTIKRRWTEIMMMKKELSQYLESQVFDSLSTIENNQICKAEQLNEVSIKARIECLNQFFKQLIMLDAKLECFSNFFNKDYNFQPTDETEEIHLTSFVSNSKGLTLTNKHSQNLNETPNTDCEMSVTETNTCQEMESLSNNSSATNEIIIVSEYDQSLIPSAVITNNIKLTAKYKQVKEDEHNEYNNIWQIKIQIKIMEWSHEIKKEFKEIFALYQFLKFQTDLDQQLSSEKEVKKEFLKSCYGECIELNEEELDNVYEELRSDQEDFLQYVVSNEKLIRYKKVRAFLDIPNDLNDLISI